MSVVAPALFNGHFANWQNTYIYTYVNIYIYVYILAVLKNIHDQQSCNVHEYMYVYM